VSRVQKGADVSRVQTGADVSRVQTGADVSRVQTGADVSRVQKGQCSGSVVQCTGRGEVRGLVYNAGGVVAGVAGVSEGDIVECEQAKVLRSAHRIYRVLH
jgi:hypothetical protein